MSEATLSIIGQRRDLAIMDVVFVHGIGGHPYNTWIGGSTEEDAFWPQWLYDKIEDVQVWTAGYPSALSEWIGPSQPLKSIAIGLLDRLSLRIGSRPIAFVCHSLGGLVVKQMLQLATGGQTSTSYSSLVGRVKGVVFLGTPHQGSSLADWASFIDRALTGGGFARISKTTQELSEKNVDLEHLSDWFRAYALDARIMCKVYSESLPTHGRLIVDHHSANPGLVGVQVVPLTLDHSGLAGPRKRDDHVSEGIIGFVRELISIPSDDKVGCIHMAVSLEQPDQSQWNRGDASVLRYAVNTETMSINISYVLGYKDLFQSGGPIRPMSYLTGTSCPFLWNHPKLDFKFVNNKPETIFLHELLLDVKESKVDDFPMFAIRRDDQQRNAGVMSLVNESWLTLHELKIDFNVVPGLMDELADEVATYENSVLFDRLEDRLDIDILPGFERAGVDVQDLCLLTNGEWDEDRYELPDTQGNAASLSEDEFNQRLQKALGGFQGWVGTVYGEITFLIYPDQAAGFPSTVRFQTFVYLINENRFGLPRPASFKYDLSLKAEGENYQEMTTISHELRPGDTDRFTLSLGVPRSSRHRFTAIVRDLSGSDLRSMPINLSCFIPRSAGRAFGPSR